MLHDVIGPTVFMIKRTKITSKEMKLLLNIIVNYYNTTFPLKRKRMQLPIFFQKEYQDGSLSRV